MATTYWPTTDLAAARADAWDQTSSAMVDAFKQQWAHLGQREQQPVAQQAMPSPAGPGLDTSPVARRLSLGDLQQQAQAPTAPTAQAAPVEAAPAPPRQPEPERPSLAASLPSLESLTAGWQQPKPAQQPGGQDQQALTPLQPVGGEQPGAPPQRLAANPGQMSTNPQQPVSRTDGTGAAPAEARIDTSSPNAFIAGLAPAAQAAEQRYGVPASVLLAIAANESGWGKSALAQQQNNLFGWKGKQPGTWSTFSSPQEAVDAMGQMLAQDPRYAVALQQRGDPATYVQALADAGYIQPDQAQAWVGQIQSLTQQVGGRMPQQGAGGGAPVQGSGAASGQGPADVNAGVPPKYDLRNIVPNQFTESDAIGLPPDAASATCGIAGAVALARAGGKPATFQQAYDLANQLGEWSKQNGMNRGSTGEVALLNNLGIQAEIHPLNEDEVTQAVRAGRPVEINAQGSGGHFYIASDVRDTPQGREFYFGDSARILRLSHGQAWFRLDQLPSLGVGTPREAIYLSAQAGSAAGGNVQ